MTPAEAALAVLEGSKPFLLIVGESMLDLGEGRAMVAFAQYASAGLTPEQAVDLAASCARSLREDGSFRGED